MTIIAHITDLHLVEPCHSLRSTAARARLEYLSFGRAIDWRGRRERFARALEQALAASADHIVITGDLTEDGENLQFELLAEVLGESRWRPDRVTLIPGNHDVYADASAWRRATEGPLAPYLKTSDRCSALELGGATIIPISTAFHQSCLRSAGRIEADQMEWLAELIADPAFARRPLVIAQHHPPSRHPIPLMQWFDGLQNYAEVRPLFARAEHVSVLHGHTHRLTDRRVGAARVFGARAVVDRAPGAPLRLYEAGPSGLWPLIEEGDTGAGVEALSRA